MGLFIFFCSFPCFVNVLENMKACFLILCDLLTVYEVSIIFFCEKSIVFKKSKKFDPYGEAYLLYRLCRAKTKNGYTVKNSQK